MYAHRKLRNNVQDFTPDEITQIEERRVRLDAYWRDYEDAQAEIEILDEKEVSDRVVFEEVFYTLCAKIKRCISHTYSNRETAAVSRSSSHSAETMTDSLSRVRLPKISLPTFSGKHEEWLPFHDIFKSIIHNNASLSNIQRFQYLRSSLTGDALNLVSPLETSNRNYCVAWNILTE